MTARAAASGAWRTTKLVADASVFYQKLRHCHWHVRGERFFELHEKRDEQDKNLWMLRAWLGE